MFGLMAKVANCNVVKKVHDSVSHYLDLRVAREEEDFKEIEAEYRRLHRLNEKFARGEAVESGCDISKISEEMEDIDMLYTDFIKAAHSDRLKRNHRYPQHSTSQSR